MKKNHIPYIITLALIDLSILAFTYFCSEVHEDGLTTLFYSGFVAGINIIACIILKNYGSRSKKSEKVRLSLTDNALHRKLRKR